MEDQSLCCDTAWEMLGITCMMLEDYYGQDCSGCTCPGDAPGYDDGCECGDDICSPEENSENCPDDCFDNSFNCGNGDVTNDGVIDVLDVVLLVQIVLGNIAPSEEEFCLGDISLGEEDGDGVLNISSV
jgi:hypothetical protein